MGLKRSKLLILIPCSLALLPACDNAPPVLTNIETSALSYTEGDPATEIMRIIFVRDTDDRSLSSARIRISNNYQSNEDKLAYNGSPPTGIIVYTNNDTLILSGSGKLSDYQTALRAITYRNTNTTAPKTSTRTVTFTVSDGNNDSNSVSRDIIVRNVNDAPILDDTKDGDGRTSAIKLEPVSEDAEAPLE